MSVVTRAGGLAVVGNSGGSAALPHYLASLSKAQYDAVTAPPNIPLQILAGPGSGKTRVLVARVTWLILANDIRPNHLVVVTFTNKAANEMRQRLHKLIGPERTANLILGGSFITRKRCLHTLILTITFHKGTFHATCARYLRRSAKSVGLQNNFSICDADESKKTIKALLKNKKDQLEAMGLPGNLKVEQIMSEISKAKAKDMDPEAFVIHLNQISVEQSNGGSSSNSSTGRRGESTNVRRAAAEIYVDYQEYLKSNNAVDFDDLLVYGVRLFREDANVIGNVQHVLVDEFQDTNPIQYSLMAELAGPNGSRHSVSVVGDPDQSIYGWRSAEVGNLALMKQDFGGKRVKDGEASEGVKQVFLEENYRSTGNILKAAKGIIEGGEFT
jgi:DNA helicase-2/ATP-dependent DNA helicase PcrA